MVIDLTNQNVVNWRGDDSFLKYLLMLGIGIKHLFDFLFQLV